VQTPEGHFCAEKAHRDITRVALLFGSNTYEVFKGKSLAFYFIPKPPAIVSHPEL
jgi:hypothetical protein